MRTPRILLSSIILFAAGAFAAPARLPIQLPSGAKPTAIEIGAQGDLYVAGSIWTPYPNVAVADSFLARYNLTSNTLIYLTKFGAAARFTQNGLAIDATGAAYLIGDAPGLFPLTIPPTNPTSSGGVVLLKVGSTGQVTYSTQIPTANHGGGIAINASGEAYITGTAPTTGLPATIGAAANRANTGFVAKLDATGANILWVNRGIGGVAIALDAQQNVYAAGAFSLFDPADPTGPPLTTTGIPHPTPFGACLATFLGSSPCSHQHVAKLDPSGTTLLYGVYLTGLYGARPSSMAVDSQGDVYLSGFTPSSDFPVTAGAIDAAYHGIASPISPQLASGSTVTPHLVVFEAPSEIGFVSELNPDASALVFSTYLGSTPSTPSPNIVGPTTRDGVTKLRLYKNQIYVTGTTNGAGFPGLADLPKSCLPATFVLRVASDGRSVDQAHSLAVANSVNTIADAGGVIPSASIAFDAQGLIYQVGPFDGVDRLDPTVADLPSSCIADSATYQVTQTVAPGQILSVFGSTLGGAAAAAAPNAGGILPTTLGTTSVDFDGIPARLLYASAQQVNVMVPYEQLAGHTQTTMNLRTTTSGTSTVQSTAVLDLAIRNPSVFGLDMPSTLCGEVDDTLVRLADGTFNSCTNPATGGSIVSLFINGAGIPGFTPTSGQISSQATPTNLPVAVALSTGSSAVTGTLDVVNFSLEPGSVSGVWRLDLRVPSPQSGTGYLLFTVTVGGVPIENRNLSMFIK